MKMESKYCIGDMVYCLNYVGDNEWVEICKDRDSGNQDVFIPLYFDKTCKRLCNYRGENKYYKWEEVK